MVGESDWLSTNKILTIRLQKTMRCGKTYPIRKIFALHFYSFINFFAQQSILFYNEIGNGTSLIFHKSHKVKVTTMLFYDEKKIFSVVEIQLD